MHGKLFGLLDTETNTWVDAEGFAWHTETAAKRKYNAHAKWRFDGYPAFSKQTRVVVREVLITCK